MRREFAALRAVLGGAGAVLGMAWLSGCAPAASDTKTNWFASCDTDAHCGEYGSCFCGLCTTLCETSSDCEVGTCGSLLATSVQCAGESPSPPEGARICLPDSGAACFESELLDERLLSEAPVACDRPETLICEGFDEALPDTYTLWQSAPNGVRLQDCETHTGSGALHFSSTGSSVTQLLLPLPSPLSSGSVHARFYARLAPSNLLGTYLILFELWDRDEGDVPERTTLYLTKQGHLEAFVGSSEITFSTDPSTALAPDTWHCVELGLDLSETAGTLTVALNGVPLVEGGELDTLATNPWVVAVVSSSSLYPEGAADVDLLIDDLVVATHPIGCE